MHSPKSHKHPPSPEEQLLVLRSQLEVDQIVITRELLLGVVECLNPYYFGSGVDLFAYYDKAVDEKTRARDITNKVVAHMNMVDEWCNSWYRCARPEWLDVMADILIEPPLSWTLDEAFAGLFLNVAGKFPDKAVQVLVILLSDQKVHPRLAMLLRNLYENQFADND